MIDKPENPQAFPQHTFNQGPNGSGQWEHKGGMTQRDYTAVAFASAIITNSSISHSIVSARLDITTTANRVAEAGYLFADAMLKARAK